MTREGVPIKVKIGLRPNGYADYPDWTALPLAVDAPDREAREAIVSAHQIVKWVYDACCGHEEDEPDSPVGMQWGMMIVTEQFADEAMALWPNLVFEMTEAEAEAFWNGRGMARVPDQGTDTEIITGLESQLNLMTARAMDTTAINDKIDRALDPDDPEPGITRNVTKTWQGAKGRMGFGVIPPAQRQKL